VFVKAAEELRRLISVHNPDVVIAVGEAPGRSAVSIERVALNLMNARIPDATGYQPRDEPVDAPAPNALWTGLPVYACLTAAQQTPGKTELSYSAGTFVCNDVFYRLMNSPEARGRRAGFVHVPTVDMMPSEQTSRALAAIATAALHDEEIEGFAEGGTIA
jgi:pyroglutamyl-peptidase